MNQNTKRLVILNLPYVLMGLYATNLGYAWRQSPAFTRWIWRWVPAAAQGCGWRST